MGFQASGRQCWKKGIFNSLRKDSDMIEKKLRLLTGMMLIPLYLALAVHAEQTDKAVPERNIHGISVKDPYRWMEDHESPDVQSWAQKETAHSMQFVAGSGYEAMRRRIFELSNFDLRYAAKIRGDRLFFLKRPEGGAPVELWSKEQGKAKLLLTSDQVPDNEYKKSFIGGRNFGGTHWPDRAGDMVAYAYNDGTSQAAKVRILDTNSGLHLEEELRDVGHGWLSPVWRADGRGFFYNKTIAVPVEGETGERVRQLGLFYHELGTPQSADRAIIEQQDGDRMSYSPAVSADGRHLIVSRREGLQPKNDYLIYRATDLEAPAYRLFEGLDARFRYLGSDGNRLYFQTYFEAPNGRIIYVDLSEPAQLVELVAEVDAPMLVGSSVGGDIIGYAGGYFLVGYLRDGVSQVTVYSADGQNSYRLNVPTGHTIWGGIQGGLNDHRVSISTLSALSPAVISSVDVRTGEITREFETPVPINPDDFVIERVFYTSKDGTRVPMSVVRHKNVKLDGSNPALMYGYGMHNWVSFLFYQPHILHWLEMGGVYAMPAIRGGGEYGENWHQAGIRANRQNAMDDFVWAGRWLIENGYTSARRLAANGSSASGPLAGMVAVRHSDVFAASTVDYPVADMVRAPLFGNGALMTEEYGSLEVAAEARSIIANSPYHQAQTEACRMPTLVMVGEEDRVVLPFHGFKLAASLQASQKCDNPILFRLMPETGHNYGNTPERTAENAAVQLAFLKKVLDF